MQQIVDLLLFFTSYAVLIYWIMKVFKNKEGRTLGLRLTSRQIITLVIAEVVLFGIMYANYFAYDSPDVADSFAWHYSITYARGVLPIAGLSSINDKMLSLKDPVLICLLSCLIVDYILLFVSTKIADAVKKH